MNLLSETKISCPYCGESINVLIDCSQGNQEYTEDCQVCCRPIVFRVTLLDDEPVVSVYTEDEAY